MLLDNHHLDANGEGIASTDKRLIEFGIGEGRLQSPLVIEAERGDAVWAVFSGFCREVDYVLPQSRKLPSNVHVLADPERSKLRSRKLWTLPHETDALNHAKSPIALQSVSKSGASVTAIMPVRDARAITPASQVNFTARAAEDEAAAG